MKAKMQNETYFEVGRTYYHTLVDTVSAWICEAITLTENVDTYLMENVRTGENRLVVVGTVQDEIMMNDWYEHKADAEFAAEMNEERSRDDVDYVIKKEEHEDA